MPLPFQPPLIARFADAIRALPPLSRYTPEHLRTETFRLYSDEQIEIYYAPFDAVNHSAQVAIVGLTPGFQQMEIAFWCARSALISGATETDACTEAKLQASFAGTMRSNLVAMLDDIGVANALAINTSADLFAAASSLLHATSAICYPVFVNGNNYTGHQPHPLKHPVLRQFIFEVLAPELTTAPAALVVPLGKAVGDALEAVISWGSLNRERCLLGFPHPSGGNGHRKRQFAERRSELAAKVNNWFAKLAGSCAAP